MKYVAKEGAVIDSQTKTVWYAGWEQWEAEEIALALNTGDYSRMILRAESVIIGVKKSDEA